MTLSVIVPSYNYGQYLEEALRSVADQTSPADEVIIMDDCSSDNTEEVARKFVPRYKYVRNQKNLGTPANIDKGVVLSRGDLIVVLDADNRLRPQYIEKLRGLFDDGKIGVVYTQCAVFGNLARQVSEHSTWWRNRKIENGYLIWEYFNFDRKVLAQRNYIHGSSMYRRICYDEAGGYVKNHIPGKGEDYTLWKKILLGGRWSAHYFEEPLLEYRHHSRSQRAFRGHM